MSETTLTPFGEKLRQLRAARSMTQKQMADALGVSAAYLSALEHGKRGQPRWILVQEIIRVLDIIWDEADELQRLAACSDPRVTIDTSELSATATELANTLNQTIRYLDNDEMIELMIRLNAARQRRR